ENSAIPAKLSGQTLTLAAMLAPPIASELASGSDYNGDGRLSLDEIFYDRNMISVQLAIMEAARNFSLETLGKITGAIFERLNRFAPPDRSPSIDPPPL